ncbi:hypothetical protein [Caulobacter phage Cr30]|uniref:hypothetical protein n=1 Tax=Caulobacter phage Cr30 TaxID=1357714 RepID=UPI0004A9BAD8|nr:hypothetical protein OZ74_gp241 [Caulobacter phage Cr30]AGS81102.1 hypothetical protein [Caulobacter phage Cr30]
MQTEPWTSDWKLFPYCVVADAFDPDQDYRGIRVGELSAKDQFRKLIESSNYKEVAIFQLFSETEIVRIEHWKFEE